jgi:NTE family protein
MNRLIDEMPVPEREGMRLVEILVLRPSRDLGKLAGEFEPKLPRAFRYLTRGLGTRRTTSPDILSLLMFQTDYLRRLVELGEGDVEANKDRIDAFIGHQPATL